MAIVVAVILVLVAAAAIMFVNRTDASGDELILGKGTPTQTTYNLEKVADSASQAKGLSGRTGLANNAGMLFTYPDTAKRCMWMKDMKFNIDIVWFSAEHRISSIVSDLSPATYPQSYCADAQYVIELPSGSTNRAGLRVGQIVQF